MINNQLITFRKLTLQDLPLLQQWLNQPYVHEWYDKDKQNTLEEVTKRYAPKIKGEKPTDCYFVLYEDKPVAYIHTYKVNDWPELGNYVDCDDYTASVDLFIGDPSFMGKGFGSIMLKKFVREIVFLNDEINTCMIGPEPNNKRAIRAYEKAGFQYTKTVKIPTDPELIYVMEMRRGM